VIYNETVFMWALTPTLLVITPICQWTRYDMWSQSMETCCPWCQLQFPSSCSRRGCRDELWGRLQRTSTSGGAEDGSCMGGHTVLCCTSVELAGAGICVGLSMGRWQSWSWLSDGDCTCSAGHLPCPLWGETWTRLYLSSVTAWNIWASAAGVMRPPVTFAGHCVHPVSW